MKFSISRKMACGFGVLLLLTVTQTAVVLYNLAEMDRQYSLAIKRDAAAIANARHLSKLVIDMETGQRGFVITGDDEFLEPYDNAVKEFAALVKAEKKLVVDNPTQVRLLERIEGSVAEWEQQAAQPEIAMRRRVAQAGVDAQHLQEVLSRGVGKGILDRIRGVTAEMERAFRIDGNIEAVVLLKSIEKSVVDRETGQRGFLITGKDEFLEPYDAGQSEFKEHLAGLRLIVDQAHDRKGTSNDVEQLETLYSRWDAERAEPVIAMRRKVTSETATQQDLEALLEEHKGVLAMGQIRETMARMRNRFRVARNDALQDFLMKAEKSIVDQETGLRGFVISGNGEALEPYFVGRSAWQKALANLRRQNGNAYDIERMTGRLNTLEELSQQWLKEAAEPEIAARRVMNQSPESLRDLAAMLQAGTGKRILDRIRGQFDAFIAEEQRAAGMRINDASLASRTTSYTAIAVALLSLALGGLVAVLITRAITIPLHRLKTTFERVAIGDLSQSVSVKSQDELGEVASSFNTMLTDWRWLEADRARSEEELRESQEFAQNIVSSMNEMLVVLDAVGNVVTVNRSACESLGYDELELIGRPGSVLFARSSDENPAAESAVDTDFARAIEQALPIGASEMQLLCEGGAVSNLEHEMLNRRGEVIPALISVAALRSQGGDIAGLVIVAHDITLRRKAHDQLRLAKEASDAANRSKSDFLANMSHEIRTPMTAILGYAENLLDEELSEAERQNCVQTIQRNGNHLLDIINDILDLSKIESGKTTIERVDCDLCDLVSQVDSLMRVRADAKGLALKTDFAGPIPKVVQTDPVRLRQILINLVGNAVKFTELGYVRLTTRYVDGAENPGLQFDVTDTGCGLTADQIETLFDPFVQADTSSSRQFEGTGLGLSISRKFAQLLGGDLSVAGSEPGIGTTFRAAVAVTVPEGTEMVDNPVIKEKAPPDGTPNDPPPAKPLVGRRILLAEDGPDNQRLISYVLKKAGAHVTVCGNGKLAHLAANEAIEEGIPFDLILMDMQMPVMDGYEATRTLRGEGYSHPIIALTAHAMSGDRQKCLDAGCDDYTTKPINRDELIDLILKQIEIAGAVAV